MKPDLNPDERIIRDHCLSRARNHFYTYLFDLTLVLFSSVTFVYGYLRCEGDGSAMLVVGYALAVLGFVRYFYQGFIAEPHYRNLIRKYEAALGATEKTGEPK